MEIKPEKLVESLARKVADQAVQIATLEAAVAQLMAEDDSPKPEQPGM